MDRCILTLVLLILIASGTLYILTHNNKKRPLESYKMHFWRRLASLIDTCAHSDTYCDQMTQYLVIKSQTNLREALQ